MERAMGETERRRNKQIAFNTANGITPRSVSKPIFDILEIYGGASTKLTTKEETALVAEKHAEYVITDPKVVMKRIKELEVDMRLKAQQLQFEQAAKLRDEMVKLKEVLLMQQV